ncbi:replication initiation protein [Candidatus Tisiphia endosymbiont of Beris chalybata]|uniref:replication initiation protein n=1 Tax=Candidatus Tisiphia endosymbiont of Beris chalybata TaxID=3066262 RepID=UPI00312CA67C
MTKFDLIKHTAAVHINNILTLNQRKIANVLLYHSYKNILEDKVHSIRLNQILESLGWKENSEVTNLVKVDLKTLNKFQLEWNIFNKDKKNSWGVTTFLADVRIEKGYVYYTYSKSLREMLFNPNIYAKLNLIIQRNLKNKHALVLWEYLLEILCSSRRNIITTDYITIDNLRRLLGILGNKSYDNYAIFRAQAVLPALKEINEKSDIDVTLISKREHRKITQVAFNVSRKLPIHVNLSDVKAGISNENVDVMIADAWLKENATTLGLSLEKIQKDINKYGDKKVRKAMELTYNDFMGGKDIKSIQGYYSTALKEGWIPVTTPDIKKNIECVDIVSTMETILSNEIGIALVLKENLLKNYGIHIFRSWFNDLKIEQYGENTVIIKADTDFKASWICNNYSSYILDVLNRFDKNIQYLEFKSY